MDSPQTDDQIVSGIYPREAVNTWRWTAGSAAVALKPPAHPEPIHIDFFLPGQSPAHTIRVLVDDKEIYSHNFEKAGPYIIDTPPAQAGVVTLQIDKHFSVPSDRRELGVILSGIGYRE